MPRRSCSNKCTIQTAFGWTDKLASDCILNHRSMKRFNKLSGTIAKVVEGGPSWLDAASDQSTTIIVLSGSFPFGRRPNPLQY